MKLFKEEMASFKKLINVKEKGIFENSLSTKIFELFKTPPLETLKERKQLGLLSKVLPEWQHVTHTRYEHSLGVVAKCIVVCDLLNKNQPGIIKEQDVLELATAAALHDVGHLPVSHAAERALLSIGKYKTGVKHEERVVPLLLHENDYFSEIISLIKTNWGLKEDSIKRIAYLISSENTIKFLPKNAINFVKPKEAFRQLLSSELDLDRLDFIIRDAQKINYYPILDILEQIPTYVKGLSLEKAKIIEDDIYIDNYELCLNYKNISSAFYLLISRVLLYRHAYFAPEVRSMEATLTSLLGELLTHGISIQPIHLITIGDEDFLNNKLIDYINKIVGSDEIINKLYEYYDILTTKEKAAGFSFLTSIEIDSLENPRLREEILENIESRSYINKLKDFIILKIQNLLKDQGLSDYDVNKYDIIMDVFNLKTGGGDFLVRNGDKLHTLKDYMKGSNMHLLCSEKRLDIYVKSSFSKYFRKVIKDYIKKEFINTKHE